MADLGRAALVVTLGLSVYALIAGTTSALTNRRRLAASARNALYCSFASTLIAAAVLASALVRHGIEVHVFNQRTVGGILRMVAMLGAMVGCAAKGAALSRELEEHVARVEFHRGDGAGVHPVPFQGRVGGQQPRHEQARPFRGHRHREIT